MNVTNKTNGHSAPPHVIRHHPCSFPGKETQLESNCEETSDKLKMSKVLPKAGGRGGAVENKSFKNVNVIKVKKRLWKYSRLKETKERRHLKVVRDPGQIPVLQGEK